MKTIGEIKEEFSAAREADWNAICQMYETDLRSGVQKLVQQYRKKLDALEKEKLRMEQMMQFCRRRWGIWSGPAFRWEAKAPIVSYPDIGACQAQSYLPALTS